MVSVGCGEVLRVGRLHGGDGSVVFCPDCARLGGPGLVQPGLYSLCPFNTY